MPKLLPADTWHNLFYPPLPADYEYFADMDRFPFDVDTAGYSWRNAWRLADAAVLAYVKDWSAAGGILDRAGFTAKQQLGASADKSTKGFFACRDDGAAFAVAAFRGTDRDDPRNAQTDARVQPVERDGYTAHSGFVEALDQVWDSELQPLLAAFRRRHPDAPVYFTGHSLGAALATLAVTRWDGNCAVYVIGSPRIGDARFGAAVRAKTAAVFRFVNSQDVVTLIPPFYRHVGKEKYIDGHGTIHDDPLESMKDLDAVRGELAHDGAACLATIGHPGQFWINARSTLPLIDPPPYIVGNHSPGRYPVLIWNYYSRP